MIVEPANLSQGTRVVLHKNNIKSRYEISPCSQFDIGGELKIAKSRTVRHLFIILYIIYLWSGGNKALPENTDSTRFDNPKFGNIRSRIFSIPMLFRRFCNRPARQKEEHLRRYARTVFRTRNVLYVCRPTNRKTRPSRKFSKYSETYRVGPRRARNRATPVRPSSCRHRDGLATRRECTGPTTVYF